MRLIFIFFMLSISLLKAQISISGYVKELGSGEAIIGAIVEDSLNLRYAQSNEYGFFSIITERVVLLKVSALGYETTYFSVNFNDSAIVLEIAPHISGEVIISDTKRFEAESKVELSMEQLEKIPTLGGERDILKAITLFPGVSNTGEGSSQILVRGGSNDQNLILLDGTPVYNAAHLAGFISVFNSDAVKKVELYKGGFPASYGGRLSSVLNITMKEGNIKKLSGNFGLGIISSRLLLEGPLLKDKISFMFSARGAYLGLFTLLRQPAFNSGKVNDNFIYNFFDLNGKVNYIINPKHHVFVSFYTGRDISTVVDRYGASGVDKRYLTQGRTTFDWGNTTATLRHNWLINNKLFSKTQLSYTQYRYEFISETRSYDFIDSLFITSTFSTKSKISDLILKWQLEYNLSSQHRFKFGFDGYAHHYQPYLNQRTVEIGNTAKTDTIGNTYRNRVPEGAIFAEGLFQNNFLELHYGLRWTGAVTEGKFYQLPEPRVSLLVKINKDWAMRAAFTQMGQYIHLLANNGVGFPNDIWVPITRRVPVQKSIQYSLGGLWQGIKGLKIELEAFYKTMSGLIDYQFIGGSILGVENNWEDLVALNGKGTSYGLEFLLQKQIGKLTGQIAYTLSHSMRAFPSIQNGKAFPFKYDRRHQFNIYINWEINKHWDISGVWVYSSGHAITLPVARIQGEISLEDIFIYGDRNNARMPDYHRLDLSVHYKKIGKKGRLNTWSVDIFNVYNRQNPFAIFFRQELSYQNGQYITTGYSLYQLSLFPILPSISYNLKF